MADPIRPIVMPKWGLAMQEGMVAKWLVDDGAEVARGQEILDIETSKIANVFESPVGGVLRRRVAGEGDTLPVGALLGVCTDAGVSDADIDAFVADFQERFAELLAAAAQTAPEPETVDAGGRRIRYLAAGEGDGPPVIFIHGFTGDHTNWMLNQAEIAEVAATYAIDLPGHGGSIKEVGAGDVAEMGRAVLAFMDALDISSAHLVGHSLGGAVSLHLALDHPARVASATLLAPAGLGPEIGMDYIEGFRDAKRRKQMRPVLELLVHDPAMISGEMVELALKYKRLDGVDAALATMADAVFPGGRQALQLRDRLSELTVPARVVWGRDDRVLPAAHAEGLPAAVEVQVLDDTGHMVHLERPDEVNGAIRALVAG